MDKQSILKMHNLSSKAENNMETIIGRPDLANYIILPNFAIEIIELLDEGKSILEVETFMEKKLGEPVDVLDFAQDLVVEYRFVHIVDGKEVNPVVKIRESLSWISEKWGNFLFNRYSYIIYFALFVLGISIVCVYPKFFPRYDDVFVSNSLSFSFILTFILGWLFLFIHELAHLIAARSLGIGSKISFSHRLVFPVAETDMSNIVTTPRNLRYRAYLAGIGWDMSFFGLVIIIQYLNSAELIYFSDTIITYLRLIALTAFLRIAWQFMFFMRTDIYYVITNYYKCNNLIENTVFYLRNRFRKDVLNHSEEWELVNEHEKKVTRWYAWFYVFGVIPTIVLFVFFTIPQLYMYIFGVIKNMKEHPVFSTPFIDGIILIILTLIPMAILLNSWYRTYRERKVEIRRREEFI